MIVRRFSSAYGRSIRPHHRIQLKQNSRSARFYATEPVNSESASASQKADTTEKVEAKEKEDSEPSANASGSSAQISPAGDQQAEAESAKETKSDDTSDSKSASQPAEKLTGYKGKSREQLRQERSTVEGKRRSILHNGLSTATPIDAEGVARVIMQRIEHTTTRINPTARKPRRLPLDQEAKDMMINRMARGEHDERGILQGEDVYEQETLNDIARSTLLNPTYGSSDAERFRLKVQSLLPTARKAVPPIAKS